MTWTINPAACQAVFTTADTDTSAISTQHTTVSNKTDDAAAPFSDAKSKPIATALNGLYNRVLTHEMTAAEAHADKVVQSGKDAFNAYQRGQEEMAKGIETTANSIPEPKITDGKPMPK